MKNKTVEVEYVQHLRNELLKINKIDLNRIILLKHGKVVKTTKKEIEDFKFTGLNNTDFIIGRR